MTRQLKVYGANYCGMTRRIVAAHNMTEAARLMEFSSAKSFRDFGCETGNKEEIALALSEPGAVWEQSYQAGAKWVKVKEAPHGKLPD